MFVYDLKGKLLVGILLACQDNLSKTAITKSPHKLKVRQGEGNPCKTKEKMKALDHRKYLG